MIDSALFAGVHVPQELSLTPEQIGTRLLLRAAMGLCLDVASDQGGLPESVALHVLVDVAAGATNALTNANLLGNTLTPPGARGPRATTVIVPLFSGAFWIGRVLPSSVAPGCAHASMGKPLRLPIETSILAAAAFALASVGVEPIAAAWVFSEHAQISADALARHDAAHPERRLEPRLAGVIDHVCWQDPRRPGGLHGTTDDCIPYASLPALAADHSCGTEDLLAAMKRPYPMAVIETAREFRRRQAEAKDDESAKLDNRRWLDLRLRVADDDYRTRAGSNSSHFQLPREKVDVSLVAHLHATLRAGAPVNAVALYANFHTAALRAARWSRAAATAADAAPWVRRAFLAEALAQHFLQDSFSAGHIIGTQGGTADRIGTHDFYCESGVEGRTWDGLHDYVERGDAFMSRDDLERVVEVSEKSFDQLAHALSDDDAALPPELRPVGAHGPTYAGLDPGFDTCRRDAIQPGVEDLADAPFVQAIVRGWPIPAAADPLPPRFPAQLLLFAGVSTQAAGAVAASTRDGGASGQFLGFLGATVGLAAEGISARRMEGPVYADVLLFGARWRDDAPILNFPVGVHVHAPFAILPGDGALFIPLAAFTNWSAPGWMAYQAATGTAAWGVERVHYWDKITFQIILGRDATLAWFRTRGSADREFDLLLPAVAFGQLPNTVLHTAFDWNATLGFEYSRRSQQPTGGADVTTTYLGGYLAFLTQTRLYAP